MAQWQIALHSSIGNLYYNSILLLIFRLQNNSYAFKNPVTSFAKFLPLQKLNYPGKLKKTNFSFLISYLDQIVY